MKKTKIALAALCVGTLLFSTVPSSAIPLGQETHRTPPSYEQMAGRMVNYMTTCDKVLRTSYGEYPVMLAFDADTNHLKVSVWPKGDVFGDFNPDFVMHGWKTDRYDFLDKRFLDKIYKKNEDGVSYTPTDLSSFTNKQKQALKNLYLDIVSKLYFENEENMDKLENLPKQNKKMKEVVDIIQKFWISLD